MRVPYLDLKAQYYSIRAEISGALSAVLDRTAFAGGPFVEQFERRFASFCGCKSAVGVSSGTSALWLALRALGIERGDEVITTPNTFIATAEAISSCGATPVFVDIDEQTYTMDPTLLEAAITPRTKAVIPVHLYGQPVDMVPVLDIARRHGLYVVEDACQAHGAEYKGHRAGSLGHAGCFSFYPGKNLGAYGDAGAVVTNDLDLADTVRLLRDHGQREKYHHLKVGWNARMDGFQGAILNVKLKYLAQWNEARRRHALSYRRFLTDTAAIALPVEADYAKHVYHIYAVRTRDRDALLKELAREGIGCGIHYPIPVHLQKAYECLGYPKGSFPIVERCANEIISLPMFPELTVPQIEKVARAVLSFIGSGRRTRVAADAKFVAHRTRAAAGARQTRRAATRPAVLPGRTGKVAADVPA